MATSIKGELLLSENTTDFLEDSELEQMLLTLIHGFAGSVQAFAGMPGELGKSLEGMADKLLELYNKEKIAALASAAIKEADADKDGKISWKEWQEWFPKGIDTAFGSLSSIFQFSS